MAPAASRLGDAEINIDYSYCGEDPQYVPVIIFDVADAELAASILDRRFAAA